MRIRCREDGVLIQHMELPLDLARGRVDVINTSIFTAEDPVEDVIPGISQCSINSRINISNDPDFEINQVVALLSSDPVLAMETLRFATALGTHWLSQM